jgi:hypothetical protein
MFSLMSNVELRIVRTLLEAVHIVLREDFDLFVVEGKGSLTIEQATNARQHFPSLEILLLVEGEDESLRQRATQQEIAVIATNCSDRALRRRLHQLVSTFQGTETNAAEGVDPCHSLIGNLNQFSAAEILQMCCMGQRSGRFTFKSGRGTSEIYLHHGMVRHATFDSLEGEGAVAEIFRWRQGRFFFEEGIISQFQTVNRPWTHLLLDNLQKLDETMGVVATGTPG